MSLKYTTLSVDESRYKIPTKQDLIEKVIILGGVGGINAESCE